MTFATATLLIAALLLAVYMDVRVLRAITRLFSTFYRRALNPDR